MNSQGLAGLDAGDVNFLRPAMGGASQQQTLRTIDILNKYFSQANIPPQQGEQLVRAAVSSGSKFEQIGNTVMAFKPLPPNAAQVYFFSTDTPEAFAQALVKFVSMLKQAGVRAVYLNKVDPLMIRGMQAVGMQPQQSDRPNYKVMAAL